MAPSRMPSEEELARTVEARLLTTEVIARTFVDRPAATIHPAPASLDPQGKQALEGLGAPSLARRVASGLDVGETLGEGGMGLVRVATQRALGRSVVVKTLKPGAEPSASLRLLREAWVTGQLEHPNVVPVYDLGVDEAGLPLIVLKRIEGAPWSGLIADAEAARARLGEADLLEWNLRTLVQVARALEFAHARGVLHRDIKPENVMIGAFGEVYLVDWGIAVSLRDDATGRLPLAKHVRDVTGTPSYMAPEMLTPDPTLLGAHTDVYLLGATLYEVACGHPPHRGATLGAMILSIARSAPELPDDVPAELAAIVRRAMARDPSERHAGVAELRAEVEGFLRHRGSAQIAAEARARNRELDALLASPDAADARARLYDLFGECRFGYRQALRSWQENEVAAAGLLAASEAMIEHELAHGSADAAAAILAELPNPPDALARRARASIDEKRAKEARVRELAKKGHEADPRVGWRTRALGALVFGGIWLALPLGTHLAHLRVDYVMLVAVSLALALVIGAFNLWARDTMRRSATLRLQGRIALFVCVAQGLLFTGGWLAGAAPTLAMALSIPMWGLGAAILALAIDLRLALVGVGYALATLVAASHLEWVWIVAAVSNGFAGVVTAGVSTLIGREAGERLREPPPPPPV